MPKYQQLANKSTFFYDGDQTHPVKSIEIMENQSFKITCENEKDAAAFQRIANFISSCNGDDSEPLDYSIRRDDTVKTNFHLSGNDACAFLPLLVGTQLLSESLLAEIMKEISKENQPPMLKDQLQGCIIS